MLNFRDNNNCLQKNWPACSCVIDNKVLQFFSNLKEKTTSMWDLEKRNSFQLWTVIKSQRNISILKFNNFGTSWVIHITFTSLESGVKKVLFK